MGTCTFCSSNDDHLKISKKGLNYYLYKGHELFEYDESFSLPLLLSLILFELPWCSDAISVFRKFLLGSLQFAENRRKDHIPP